MMKWPMLTLLALTGAAQAAPTQSCVLLGHGALHVVATVSRPADCCTGRTRCAQFLSTTAVVRPVRPERT